jgi:hypothetical protein
MLSKINNTLSITTELAAAVGGTVVGNLVRIIDGAVVGLAVGLNDGTVVGNLVRIIDGAVVGLAVDGTVVGLAVGIMDGTVVGRLVGSCDGTGVYRTSAEEDHPKVNT